MYVSENQQRTTIYTTAREWKNVLLMCEIGRWDASVSGVYVYDTMSETGVTWWFCRDGNVCVRVNRPNHIYPTTLKIKKVTYPSSTIEWYPDTRMYPRQPHPHPHPHPHT